MGISSQFASPIAIKNLGLFADKAALDAAHPSPEEGDVARVDNVSGFANPFSIIFENWGDGSSSAGFPYSRVNYHEYLVRYNGNQWVIFPGNVDENVIWTVPNGLPISAQATLVWIYNGGWMSTFTLPSVIGNPSQPLPRLGQQLFFMNDAVLTTTVLSVNTTGSDEIYTEGQAGIYIMGGEKPFWSLVQRLDFNV